MEDLIKRLQNLARCDISPLKNKYLIKQRQNHTALKIKHVPKHFHNNGVKVLQRQGAFNSSQLAKLKKSIPLMLLP